MGRYLKFGASAAGGGFCESVQVGIDTLQPSSRVSGQASLISMVFSCLC